MLDVEARLLAGGFCDVRTLYILADRYDVTIAAFADPNHAILFGLLLCAAELDIDPTVVELQHAAVKYGALWADAGYPTDLERILVRESSPANIERHMRLVADCARRRGRAKALIVEVGALLEGIILPVRGRRIPTRNVSRKEAPRVPVHS